MTPLDHWRSRLQEIEAESALISEELQQPALPGFEEAKEAFHRNRWEALLNLAAEREALQADIRDLERIRE